VGATLAVTCFRNCTVCRVRDGARLYWLKRSSISVCITAALWNFSPVVSSFYLSFSSIYLAYSQPSQIACLPYFHTWCVLSANLRCRFETCCTRLAGNRGHKNHQKFAICAPSHNSVGLYLCNKSRIDNRKKLVKQRYVLHMSPQYGELRPTNG